jgi:hypothetical protein
MGTVFEKSKGRCMKFFWRYVWRKLNDIGNEPKVEAPRGLGIKGANYATTASDGDWSDGLNIRVHTAMGGKIVSFNRYDRKSDRDNRTVYVIPDDHDFERELGKLITLESMKG